MVLSDCLRSNTRIEDSTAMAARCSAFSLLDEFTGSEAAFLAVLQKIDRSLNRDQISVKGTDDGNRGLVDIATQRSDLSPTARRSRREQKNKR